jgi:hypothetical protein
MTTLSISREEFVALLETTEVCIQQRSRAELRRLRVCAELSREIARIRACRSDRSRRNWDRLKARTCWNCSTGSKKSREYTSRCRDESATRSL